MALTRLAYPRFLRLAERLSQQRGWSDGRIFATALLVTHGVVYALENGFFFLCDRMQLLQRYKLARPQGPDVPSVQSQLATVREFVTGLLPSYFASFLLLKMYERRGAPSLRAPLESPLKMWMDFALAFWFNSFGFYYAHRLFHSKALYARFHKKHHQYVQTVGLAAEHSHPAEGLLANLLPTLGGCLLSGSHPFVFVVWMAWRLQQTYEAHSGYCFAGSWLHRLGLTNSDSAAFHDHHHLLNKGNFGGELTDWLHGTADSWYDMGGKEGYLEYAKKVNGADE